MRTSRLLTLILILAINLELQSAPVQKDDFRVISVDVILQDWLDGYLAWMDHTPQALNLHGAGAKQLKIKMPVLELYAPDGHVLYRGANAQQNAVFLDKLQVFTPKTLEDNIGQPSPSLAEYLDLVAQLRPYKSGIIASHQITLIAVTYPDKSFCQAQNDAMKRFKEHAVSRKVRVVEIRLHA